jgi:hypothetical protein
MNAAVQLGIFDAVNQMDAEARRKATEERLRWTPEKARGYEPGHPWADPALYPTAAEIIAHHDAAPPRPNLIPHDYPRKAKGNKRESALASYRAELKQCVEIYERRRSEIGRADHTDEAFRVSLALTHNHVSYYAYVIRAVLAAEAEAA